MGKKELVNDPQQDANQVKTKRTGNVPFFSFPPPWAKTSIFCKQLEPGRADEVHQASTVQHAWQLTGSYESYQWEINCKQYKLYRVPGLQVVENRMFLYYRCGALQTSEEVKETEII